MRPLVRDSLITTIAFFLQRGLGFIREIVVAGLLGPYYMGLRNTIILLFNYSHYIYLGMDSELNRRVAKTHKKDPNLAKKMLSTVLHWSYIASISLAILVAIAAFLVDVSEEFRLSLYLLSILVILRSFPTPTVFYFQALGRFKFTSAVETIQVFSNFVLVIGLTYFMGYIGAILGLLLSFLIRFILYWRERSKYEIEFIFDFDLFKDIFAKGLRLFVTSISSTIYSQMESMVTIIMLGPAALGIYGIAASINSLIYGTYSSTVIPLGQRMLQVADVEEQLKKYLEISLGLSSYLMVFPIALMIFVSPFVINTFIPDFTGAIPIILILASASFFNVTINPLRNYLIAKNRENVITSTTLFSAFLNLVIDYYLINQGYGITGVAIGASVSYMINYLLIVYFAKVLDFRTIVEDIFPVVYLVFLVSSFSNPIVCVLLTVIYIPILHVVFTRRGIMHYIGLVLSDLNLLIKL